MKYRFGIDEVKGNYVKSTSGICKRYHCIVDLNLLLFVSNYSIYYSSFSESTFSCFILSFVELACSFFGSTNEGTLMTTRSSRFEEWY